MKKKNQKRKEKILWVGAVITVIILSVAILAYILSKPKYSTSEFLEVIKKDKEVNEFFNELLGRNVSRLQVTKTKLTRQDIVIEQYGPYKNEYKNISLDREEVYKVELVTEKREMIVIVDMKNKEVLNSYGILNIRIQ